MVARKSGHVVAVAALAGEWFKINATIKNHTPLVWTKLSRGFHLKKWIEKSLTFE